MIKARYFNISARHPFSSWCNTVILDTCSDGANLPTCHQWKQYVLQNIRNIANRNLTICFLWLFDYCVPFANTTVVWLLCLFWPSSFCLIVYFVIVCMMIFYSWPFIRRSIKRHFMTFPATIQWTLIWNISCFDVFLMFVSLCMW